MAKVKIYFSDVFNVELERKDKNREEMEKEMQELQKKEWYEAKDEEKGKTIYIKVGEISMIEIDE